LPKGSFELVDVPLIVASRSGAVDAAGGAKGVDPKRSRFAWEAGVDEALEGDSVGVVVVVEAGVRREGRGGGAKLGKTVGVTDALTAISDGDAVITGVTGVADGGANRRSVVTAGKGVFAATKSSSKRRVSISRPSEGSC